MNAFVALLVAAIALPDAQPTSDDTPQALLALQSARESLMTGEVSWSIKCNRAGSPFEQRKHYFSRFGPEEAIEEFRGDGDGITGISVTDGTVDRRPHQWLSHDGATWMIVTGNTAAEVDLETDSIKNVRCLGISARLPIGDTPRGQLFGEGTAWVYTTDRADGLYEIRAREKNTLYERRLLIDPDRGWNAVRVTTLRDGVVTSEVRSKLKRFGDTWFPESTEIFDASFEGGKQPLYEFAVQSAEFNQPYHERRFTPEDIGIAIGTNLYVNKDYKPAGLFGWDGTKIVPYDELLARIKSGELKTPEWFAEIVNRRQAEGKIFKHLLTEWERYTLAFIERYELDQGQTERAWAILRDCQDRGNAYLDRVNNEMERIRKSVNELYDAEESKAGDRRARLDVLKKQMNKLGWPIWKIEHKELRPRLEKLPTREQRRRVEEAEGKQQSASAPASAKAP